MKRFTILGSLLAIVLAVGIQAARLSKYEHHSSQYITLTESATTDLTVRKDTIWFSRNIIGPSGGEVASLSMRDFSGYRVQVVVGPMRPADTAAAVLGGSGAGMVDSAMLVVKKKLGNIVSLVDSTTYVQFRMRTAAATLNRTFFIGAAATDTMILADELFGVLYVADSASDSAGVLIKYPVSAAGYFKE